MFNIHQVNFKVLSNDGRKGVFEVTPLIKGFGHTIGSALRRTLYSATPGAAITKVSIEGVAHQFTTINGATDDVLHMLLNLKKIRIKKLNEGEAVLDLDVTGPAEVKASDIEVESGIEVINKDLVITTLATKKDRLKAKITVSSGYGYIPIDEAETTPIGVIALDANYSPIVNVTVSVEDTRVGRDTNFDKLTLEVITDGTADPEEAVRNASTVLKEFFYKVQTGQDYTPEQDVEMEATAEQSTNGQPKMQADEVALEELHLPTRTINALRKSGIKTLGDLADRSEDDLLRVRNLGEKSIREILSLLEREGLK